MKRKMITRDCAECFDRFRSLDPSRTLCKTCLAELSRRLNEAIAAHIAQRKADNAREAMERRARFWANRRPIDFEQLLW